MEAASWVSIWKGKTKVADGEIEQKDVSRRLWTEVGGQCTPLLDEISFSCDEVEFFRRIGIAIDNSPTGKVWIKPNSGCGVHASFTKSPGGKVEAVSMAGYKDWTSFSDWRRTCLTKIPRYASFVRSYLVEPILDSLYHINCHVVDGRLCLLMVHCIPYVGSCQGGRRLLYIPVLDGRIGDPYDNKDGGPIPNYVSMHWKGKRVDEMQRLLVRYMKLLPLQFQGAFRVDFMAFSDGRLLHTGDGTTNIRDLKPCKSFEDNAVRTLCFCDDADRAQALEIARRSPKLCNLVTTWVSPWDVYDRRRGWCSASQS